MKTTLDSYLNFLGLRIQGDIGHITCYRSSRRGLVWFPKAPPRKPASDLQNAYRAKWRAILDDWNAFPKATKAKWMAITRKASLSIHGLDLYIWWRCSQDDSIVQTLQRQTGITVL